MDIKNYFAPLSPAFLASLATADAHKRMISIDKHQENTALPPIENYDIALLGIPDERNTHNAGTAQAPAEIRKYFYPFFQSARQAKVIDLGDLKPGKTIKDSYFAIRDIVVFLLANHTIPLIVGGGQDFSVPLFEAIAKTNTYINMVSVDSRIDLEPEKELFQADSYLNAILPAPHLFNHVAMAYQSYYVPAEWQQNPNEKKLELYRLGMVREHIEHTEPLLRDADLVSFDISALKQPDAPAHFRPSPNGISADQACQIAWYTGINDRNTCFALFEVNPKFDRQGQTAQLAAQMLWYFIEGFKQRKNDYPTEKIEEYKKYIVNMGSPSQDIVFFKSPVSDRWWFEMKAPENKKIIVACTHQDYALACKQEIPERWWRLYQKLHP